MAVPCFRDRAVAYRRRLSSYVASLGSLRLLTGMSGNVGDQLIWAGTEDLLRASGIGFEPLDVASVEATDGHDQALVIPGSGAFTLLWHGWLPDLVRLASSRFRNVVVLPSQFDATVAAVAEALSRPNVHAFAREGRSYEQIRRFGRAGIAFDCAIYCEHFPCPGRLPERAEPVADGCGTNDRLVVLREDEGSLLAHYGLAPVPRINRDLSRSAAGLEEFLRAIRDAGLVITDRLHVAVAAVMSGTPLRYLDPFDRKISDYFAFTFRDELGERAAPCSPEWLVAQGVVAGGG